eukprot:TRINITY_DN56314_c0_g1_i1.p1 TRINITY_DN56314_c0_g1~~TRINITY_DN56314_c0_g1_i1.p1  ORF type:complete len:738 (-),score=101.82 TRINITY_DN56314_c0_g1_i1:148-2361(-)
MGFGQTRGRNETYPSFSSTARDASSSDAHGGHCGVDDWSLSSSLHSEHALQVTSRRPANKLRAHQWLRREVPLPRFNVEKNFYSKVLANVRERRAKSYSPHCPGGNSADANSIVPSRSPSPTCNSSRCVVEPKYLSLACLPQGATQQWKQESLQQLVRLRAVTPQPKKPELSAPERDLSGPFICVVEASVSLTIVWVAGRKTIKVPPQTWLVLASSPESQISDGERADCDDATEEDWWLAEEAGGGRIDASAAVVSLLRFVEGKRLCLKGAEANFNRAAKGAVKLALDHATLLLRLLGGDIAGGCPAPNPTSISVIDTRILDDLNVPKVSTGELLEDRARRAACLVKHGASELARRKVRVARRALSESQDIQHSGLTPHKPPPEFIGSPKKTRLMKGFLALKDFMSFGNVRFGNPMRLWFRLDPQENMTLGQQQFMRACTLINFNGSASALWYYIDADNSGSITILELHPQSAMLLAAFKQLIVTELGGTSDTAFRQLDEHRTHRIMLSDFELALRHHPEIPLNNLFDLLDRRGLGFIVSQDLAFLDKWNPPCYVFVEPDPQGLHRIKEVLLEKQSNLLKAWRKSLDRDGTMRISWDEWRNACAELQRTGVKGIPATIEEIGAAWREMDRECSGWVPLRAWDTPAFEVLSDFKRWVDRVHGGARKAFRVLDGSANCKLSVGELKKAARGKDRFKGDLDFLFVGLDVYNAWVLTENEVRFLDDWDLAWEEWEAAHTKS